MKRFQAAILLLVLCGCGGGGGSSSTFTGGGGSGTTTTTTTTTTTSNNQNQATYSFSLTSNGNANVTPIGSGGQQTRADTSTQGRPVTQIQTTFYSTVTANQQVNQRALVVIFTKPTAITQGDIFTFSTPATLPGAQSLYNENDPNGNRGWTSTGGTITVTAISSNSASLSVSNLQLTPIPANTATGTITVNGSYTVSF